MNFLDLFCGFNVTSSAKTARNASEAAGESRFGPGMI